MRNVLSSVQARQVANEICSAQLNSGAFPSTVHSGDYVGEDANGFITALVLRELNNISAVIPTSVTERALDFLESCASESQRGAFNFYPPKSSRPKWLSSLPDDADDTAVIALELLRHNRLSRRDLIKDTCVVLNKFRLQRLEAPAPSWLRTGVFLTWFGDGSRPNVVDCCVNANITAVLAYAGLKKWRGYAEACAMIEAGLCWTESSPKKAQTLTPFYPNTGELKRAIEHAVKCGTSELENSLQLIRQNLCKTETYDPQQAICSSAYGRIIWKSGTLQKLRLLVDCSFWSFGKFKVLS